MDGARRSRTAQGVAAERALLASMGVLDDPFAHRMLTPSMGAVLWILQHGSRGVWSRSVTLAGLAARVLWFDGQVVGALNAGFEQIAVVGAGYDSRAWRLRRDGARYFELDHPATQRDKVRRSPPPGPVYVECDLTTEDAAESLVDGGLDVSRPALFVLEGLTMYLREEVVRRQLTHLAARSAIGSRLAVDFYPARNVGTSQDKWQLQIQRLARLGTDESFRLSLDCSGAIELVHQSGWDVREAPSMRDAGRLLVPRHAGLRIESINQHKTLVAADRSG